MVAPIEQLPDVVPLVEPPLVEALHVLAFATGLGITNIAPTAMIKPITKQILSTLDKSQESINVQWRIILKNPLVVGKPLVTSVVIWMVIMLLREQSFSFHLLLYLQPVVVLQRTEYYRIVFQIRSLFL